MIARPAATARNVVVELARVAFTVVEAVRAVADGGPAGRGFVAGDEVAGVAADDEDGGGEGSAVCGSGNGSVGGCH